MPVTPRGPPSNGFVALARKIYHPIGFSKGYNFVLWFILVGALFVFCLLRLQYLDFYDRFCGPGGEASPGACLDYLSERRYSIGFILHLAGILPGALLACVQFVPVVRHKFILFHRVNGYAVIILALLGTAGAFMIVDISFGGGLDVQTGIGFLGVAFVGSLVMAYVNIKRLQIEQHRAWMLRAWVYAGSIITIRILMIAMASILFKTKDYYYSMPCGKVEYAIGDRDATMAAYPGCAGYFAGTDPRQVVPVRGSLTAPSDPAEVAAALDIVFGPATWLAFVIHLIGVEIYRLRQVSYQRQVEAGMRNPGRAGLTADRLGDSEMWVPKNDGRVGSDAGLNPRK
ncbi:hypothetical protein DL762_003578 [Monosporascus cannonballus]|uniref:DUF2306 domain-containing protein n=1 Tax=Monosporascus cannonballus TaxID=155416 RepID=A0ABY0HD11_9PEZI|nr:hypothetical protein DL762_003578 [Monosporascus cannonballus]